LAFEHGLGTSVKRRVAVGNEPEAIAQVADEEGAALVVVATRRRGALKSLLAGSISFDLRTEFPRPVVVVQPDARVPLRT
jgi:nucleotide-binding universal stress UspA family protein